MRLRHDATVAEVEEDAQHHGQHDEARNTRDRPLNHPGDEPDQRPGEDEQEEDHRWRPAKRAVERRDRLLEKAVRPQL